MMSCYFKEKRYVNIITINQRVKVISRWRHVHWKWTDDECNIGSSCQGLK